MKPYNPFMLKETSRAVTGFINTLSNLMWAEYTHGVPISYILCSYDMEIIVNVRGGLRLRIGDDFYTLDSKSYNTIVADFTTIVVNHIVMKLNKYNLYVKCNTTNTKNIEKFVKDNSELIREWYIKSVNA